MSAIQTAKLTTPVPLGPLELHLRQRRDEGRSLLVPYVTAGIRDDWTDLITAYAEAGADAIEIGIPFSDPMLDGPTIQESSQRALDAGMTPARALDELAELSVDVPLIVMSYSNVIMRFGLNEFCARLHEVGVDGLIPPDTPLDEADPLLAAAEKEDVEVVLLVAPSTAPDRVRLIADRTRGFVYAVSLMGTTGERVALQDTAGQIARLVRSRTDKPVLLGFGIGSPEAAVAAATHADGVVVASAVMRQVLDGASVADVTDTIRDYRRALDQRAPA